VKWAGLDQDLGDDKDAPGDAALANPGCTPARSPSPASTHGASTTTSPTSMCSGIRFSALYVQNSTPSPI
jgi:hypothetical protein